MIELMDDCARLGERVVTNKVATIEEFAEALEELESRHHLWFGLDLLTPYEWDHIPHRSCIAADIAGKMAAEDLRRRVQVSHALAAVKSGADYDTCVTMGDFLVATGPGIGNIETIDFLRDRRKEVADDAKDIFDQQVQQAAYQSIKLMCDAVQIAKTYSPMSQYTLLIRSFAPHFTLANKYFFKEVEDAPAYTMSEVFAKMDSQFKETLEKAGFIPVSTDDGILTYRRKPSANKSCCGAQAEMKIDKPRSNDHVTLVRTAAKNAGLDIAGVAFKDIILIDNGKKTETCILDAMEDRKFTLQMLETLMRREVITVRRDQPKTEQ